MRYFTASLFLATVLVNTSNASPPKLSKLVQKRDLGCGAQKVAATTVAMLECTANSTYACQVTDSSGCNKGDPANIQSIVVTESSTGQALGGSSSVSEAGFTCPSTELAQCSVIFTDAGKSKTDQYGIRLINQ